ncbi:MAG: polymer-forming cytoskeletal protein [Henriciella sp.]
MFTKKENETTVTPSVNPAQDAIKGAASKPTARSAASIICGDMEINGSITSEGALQIDGVVDGDVTAADITIGSSGRVVGEVRAEAVKVKGEVRGSIRARKVELETGARVHGDIIHSSLSIQPNAMFEGQVKHDQDPLKSSAPKAANTGKSPSSTSDTAPSSSASTSSTVRPFGGTSSSAAS